MDSKINIKFNEKEMWIRKDLTIFEFKKTYKEEADVIILNGFPIKEDRVIKQSDSLTLIKKGEVLRAEDIESVMMARHTPLIYEKLKKSKVGVAGLGGLGSNIVAMLARIGVGNLVIADYDIVEPSNLNRQNYYINQLGELKTDATFENIKMINPFVNVEKNDVFLNKDNSIDIFDGCDIVIEAFDDAICKAELVTTILTKSKIIIVAGSGMAGIYSSNTIKTKKMNKRFYVCGDGISEAKEFCGLLSTRVSIVAGHMANTAVRLLTGEINDGMDMEEL